MTKSKAGKRTAPKRVRKSTKTTKVTKKVTSKTKAKTPRKTGTKKAPKLSKEQIPQASVNDSIENIPVQETGLTPVKQSETTVSVSTVEVNTSATDSATVPLDAPTRPVNSSFNQCGEFTLFERVRIKEGEHKGQPAFIRAIVNENTVSLDFVGSGVPSAACYSHFPISILEKF